MLVYRHRCHSVVSTAFQRLVTTFYTVDPWVVEQDSCSYLRMVYFSSRVAPCTLTHHSVWLWQRVVSASSPHSQICRCSVRNVVRMSRELYLSASRTRQTRLMQIVARCPWQGHPADQIWRTSATTHATHCASWPCSIELLQWSCWSSRTQRVAYDRLFGTSLRRSWTMDVLRSRVVVVVHAVGHYGATDILRTLICSPWPVLSYAASTDIRAFSSDSLQCQCG